MDKKVYKSKKELIEHLISPKSKVLDVGFWGQAVKRESPEWPHRILLNHAREVYGVDLSFDIGEFSHPECYVKASAEDFSFSEKFSVIFAGDIIEHLSNPGLFLSSCAKHLSPDGILIVTTPNCFNLFNIFAKLYREEPPINSDHTMYFNKTTLAKLLEKNNWKVVSFSYLDSLSKKGMEGIKRKFSYLVNGFIKLFTAKFSETLTVVAKRIEEKSSL